MVDWNREDSSCAPRSVVTDFGAPNLAIQLRRKALTIVSAVVSVKGIASGHLVKRSMQVRGRYVHVMVAMDPLDQGELVKILHLVLRRYQRGTCYDAGSSLAGSRYRTVPSCVCPSSFQTTCSDHRCA